MNTLNYKLPNLPYIKVIRSELADIKKLTMFKPDGTLMDSRPIFPHLVMDFRTIMRNNEFRPDVYVPTIVNKDYVVISGKHRYQAHLAEDKTHIPVIIVEFIDYDGLPGDCWRMTWQSNENDKKNRTFASEDRTDEQIYQTTIKQIKANYIQNTLKDITRSLKDQNIPSVNRAKYITAISNLLSTNSSTDIMYSYTTDTMRKYIVKNKLADVFSTKKDIEVDSNNTVNFTVNFYPQEAKDLDNATIFNIINAKEKYPESKIRVFYAIDSCDKQKIISYRTRKSKLIENTIVKMKKFLENYKPEDVEMIPLPQLPKEIKDE
jgi:hypothetical protein